MLTKSNSSVVYQHRRLDTNEVFYVGIGVSSKRAFNMYNRPAMWKSIVNKAGYVVELVKENITYEEAKQEEIRLIALYGRRDLNKGPLINRTDGGQGTIGRIHTEEHKAYISRISKGRPGKIPSEETRAKMSAAKKGKPLPEATRLAAIKANTGRVPSQRQLEVLNSTGRKLSKESIEKRTATRIANNGGKY